MIYILYAGSVVGALIGLVHAIYIYRRRIAGSNASWRTATYRGLWTFFLWTLFGSYLLVLWVVAVIVFSVNKMVPTRNNA